MNYFRDPEQMGSVESRLPSILLEVSGKAMQHCSYWWQLLTFYSTETQCLQQEVLFCPLEFSLLSWTRHTEWSCRHSSLFASCWGPERNGLSLWLRAALQIHCTVGRNLDWSGKRQENVLCLNYKLHNNKIVLNNSLQNIQWVPLSLTW